MLLLQSLSLKSELLSTVCKPKHIHPAHNLPEYFGFVWHCINFNMSEGLAFIIFMFRLSHRPSFLVFPGVDQSI